MATIFAIEQGCYSDYRVVGVFSSREKAEQILSIVNRGQDSEAATIAEWELDPGVKEINAGLKPHYITMDIDGITERCHEDGDGYKAGGLYVWTRTAARRPGGRLRRGRRRGNRRSRAGRPLPEDQHRRRRPPRPDLPWPCRRRGDGGCGPFTFGALKAYCAPKLFLLEKIAAMLKGLS